MLLLKFQPENFVKYLPYMAKGMIGILLVIGIIIVITAILNLISKKQK